MAQNESRFDGNDFDNASNTPSIGAEAPGDAIDFDKSLPDTDNSSITADETDELKENADNDDVV